MRDSGKTLGDFHVGTRVRTIEPHMGPSFPRGGGYDKDPDPIYWTGVVTRIGREAKVVWVQWDQIPNGQHRPVQASLLTRETARAINLQKD